MAEYSPNPIYPVIPMYEGFGIESDSLTHSQSSLEELVDANNLSQEVPRLYLASRGMNEPDFSRVARIRTAYRQQVASGVNPRAAGILAGLGFSYLKNVKPDIEKKARMRQLPDMLFH